MTDTEIVSLMVGRGVTELFPTVPHSPGKTLLSITNLSGERSPKNLSLELRRGEIIGLAGLIGADRTEFLMGELAAEGKVVLFVSSYLTELLAVCDREGVMASGLLREVRLASEWTEESIMSIAVAK